MAMMLRRRKILLAISILLVVGSIAVPLAYAIYLRSDAHRRSIEAEVSDYLRLPTDIERVTPLSRHSRRFSGVKVWLPRRSSQIFQCDQAIWRTEPTESGLQNSLAIHDGWFLLGTGDFSRDDYRFILRGGFGHDFNELDLSSVRLHNMSIVWRQPDFELRVENANGEVSFDADGGGRADLTADRLNGVDVTQPISIRAMFTPGAGLRFHLVTLEIPRIPLASLALDEVLGATMTSGWFDGVLSYRRSNGEPVFSLRGTVEDARLEELTQRLPNGPLHGIVDINLTKATFTPNRLIALEFSGDLSAVRLGDLAPFFNQPELNGQFNLRVHQARYRENQLAYLSTSGEAEAVPMEVVTRLIGRGVITGIMRVTLHSLLIVDDVIQRADIDLDVVPPADGPGTIDRQMILYAANNVLGIESTWANEVLPEKVEYVHLGCKLLIDRNELTIEGLHGADGKTILTIRVLGNELGLIQQPEKTFPMTDIMTLVRRRMAEYDMERLMQWWGD